MTSINDSTINPSEVVAIMHQYPDAFLHCADLDGVHSHAQDMANIAARLPLVNKTKIRLPKGYKAGNH